METMSEHKSDNNRNSVGVSSCTCACRCSGHDSCFRIISLSVVIYRWWFQPQSTWTDMSLLSPTTCLCITTPSTAAELGDWTLLKVRQSAVMRGLKPAEPGQKPEALQQRKEQPVLQIQKRIKTFSRSRVKTEKVIVMF